MDSHTSKSNQKRQHENENPSKPQRKSQRLLAKHQPSSSVVQPPSNEPKKITDLNDHCLGNIFECLDLRDLLNVAVANEWLRPAAHVIYKHKFGQKTVYIRNDTTNDDLQQNDDQIFVNGLKTCLQYLRCLGPALNDLSIFYRGWNGKQCEYIHHHISEYCRKSLINIEFWDKRNKNQFKGYEKPLVNVQSVKILHCDLYNQFAQFGQWFPNVRSLKLGNVCVGNNINLPAFQYLEDLSIDVKYGENRFTPTLTTRLLQQLPQLHTLNIQMFVGKALTFTELSNMIKDNANLCNLKVTQPVATHVTSSNIQHLANKNPSLAKLELFDFKFSVDTALELTQQLNSLRLFQFRIANRTVYDRLVASLDKSMAINVTSNSKQ